MKKKTIISIALILSMCSCGIYSGCSPTANTNSSNAPTSSVSDESTESPEKSGDVATESTDASEEELKSIPELSDPTPDSVGEMIDGILLYDETLYEMFYGGEESAKEYAKTISDIKTNLGDNIKVYNVIVPTHCSVTLPERVQNEYGVSDQKEYMDTLCNSYTADVIGVNTYEAMLRHRDEYLYFNTDHHWTGRAAYYAYEAFCKAAGETPIPMNEMGDEKIEGYYGSLYNMIGDGYDVKEDYVEYFTTDRNVTTKLFDSEGTYIQDTMLIHSYAEGVNAYGVFLGGDQPLMVSQNSDGNGKKIAVVKESYGNAFSPFIAYTYGETHLIDFRYIDFDLKTYLQDNNITEVLFINNNMASATPQRLEELQNMA